MKPFLALFLAILPLTSLPADSVAPNKIPDEVVQKVKQAGLTNLALSSELKIGSLFSSDHNGSVDVSAIQYLYANAIPPASSYAIRITVESLDNKKVVINIVDSEGIQGLAKLDSSMFQFPDYSGEWFGNGQSQSTPDLKITGAYISSLKLKTYTFEAQAFSVHLSEGDFRVFLDLLQKAQKAIDAQKATK